MTDAVTDLTDAEIQAQEAIRTDTISPEPGEDVGEFTMRILVEGSPTIDGRYFTPGAVDWREPPMSFLYMTKNGDNGHKGSEVGGTITKIWRDGNEIWGSGHFASNDHGQELRTLIREGVLTGVSADVGGANVELEADGEGKSMQKITGGRLMGCTALALQAFDEGKVVVTAAAGLAPIQPPSKWFQNPGLSRPTALTVTDDGQVFGHLATWGSCHVGMPGKCQTPPRSPSNYSYFKHGEVLCADGARVATGKISFGGGHAALGLSAQTATSHYDDVSTGVADIVTGEDEHGIWFSGALRPDVDETTVRNFRASAVSGDWRQIGGGLEMVALLAVNTPGFPVPRAGLVASADGSEEVTSLVSVNVVTQDTPTGEVSLSDEEDCGCDEAPAEQDFEAEFAAIKIREMRSKVGKHKSCCADCE